jgi:hypothetical protein
MDHRSIKVFLAAFAPQRTEMPLCVLIYNLTHILDIVQVPWGVVSQSMPYLRGSLSGLVARNESEGTEGGELDELAIVVMGQEMDWRFDVGGLRQHRSQRLRARDVTAEMSCEVIRGDENFPVATFRRKIWTPISRKFGS